MKQTATKRILTTSTSPYHFSYLPDVLLKINEPDVKLTLWQRIAQTDIPRELAALQASQLPDVRRPTSRATFDDDICTFLQRQGFDPIAFESFRADLRQLADLFFAVSQDRRVRFRLLTTCDDDCRRFHVDYRHLRLLCTYQGPGTEWLPEAQVDRVAFESGKPNDEIIRFGEPSQLEPFWVCLLKDDAYPGNKGQGIMHRSPPIAGTGQTRVLFCLDAQ